MKEKALGSKYETHFMYNALDAVRWLQSSCFYFSLMCFLFYMLYRSGICSFQPVYYIPLLAVYLLIHLAFRYVNSIYLVGIISILLIVMTYMFYPIRNMEWLCALIIICCVVTEYLTTERRIDKAGTGEIWYMRNSSLFWGVAILIVILLQLLINSGDDSKQVIKNSYVFSIITATLSFYIFLLIINNYFKRFFNYYKHKKRVDSIMKEQVKRVIINAGAVAALIIAFSYYVSKYIAVAFNAVVSLIISLLNSVKFSVVENAVSETLQDNTYKSSESNNAIAEKLFQSKGASSFGKGLSYVFFLLFILLVIYAVYKICRAIAHKNFRKAVQNDIIIIDNTDTIKNNKTKSFFRFNMGGNSSNEKIRRYYRQILLKNKNKGKLKNLDKMTPGEIAFELSEQKEKKRLLKEMTPLYEEARYSNKDVSSENEQKAKRISDEIISKL